MTNETTRKVRLVMCPKCQKLLPKPADVPIYSCGGCGAILQAKPRAHDASKKESNNYAPPDKEDAVPSPPEEHSPNLQSEEDKDLSSSGYTVSGESDRICSSAELSSPFPELNSDPTISTEEAAEKSPSTVASRDDEELLPTLAPNSGANVSNGNSLSVAVQSEEERNKDSVTKTDSRADGKLKTLEESSNAEEIDDQLPNVYLNASEHVPEKSTADVSRESLGKEIFVQEKPRISNGSIRNYRTMSSRSISSTSNVETLTSEGLATARVGHPTRFKTRSYGDELSLNGWSPRVNVNYEGGEGPSSRIIGNPLYSSMSYPRERPGSFLPDDKEELLRMVIEIENQLRRMGNEEDNSNGSNYNGYQQSGQRFITDPYFHDPYESASRFASSQVYSTRSWDSETEPDDRMFPGSRNSREKAQFPKRHYRPIAGASPFMTCYSCSELVQIPEEFLLSRSKRCHSLQCGACSVVLKFSFQNGMHIAPYPPTLNDQDDSINRVSTEHFNPSGDEADDSMSEIREAPSRNGSSALHQLMGYSSVSQLLLS